ncbi:MAG: hypothetical protein RL637_1727 [Pseudomonadota bacterium]|jgi:SAM-dependent methyltransferase
MRYIDSVTHEFREIGEIDELNFWRTFVQSERFEQGWLMAKPNPELQLEILLFLRGLAAHFQSEQRYLKVLDIGSGPVSILSNGFEELAVELFAADPLADHYNQLWQHELKAKVCTPIACEAENLLARFGTCAFDVTHVRNAIDHCIHPLEAADQMRLITKSGGFIIIHGAENEADRENWTGFHQWNLAVRHNDLIISGKKNIRYSFRKEFANTLKIMRCYVYPLGNVNWCGVIAQVL